MKNPSFDWEKLKDVFYRNRAIGELKWPTQYEDFRCALSLTVIAIEIQDFIQIYNYFGQLLDKINLLKIHEDIIKFEFDKDEKLILVTKRSIKIVKSWSPLTIESVPLEDSILDTIWDYHDGIMLLNESRDIYKLSGNEWELLYKNKDMKYNLLTKNHWSCNGDIIILLDIDHVYQVSTLNGILLKLMADSSWHKVTISSKGFICLYNMKYNKLQVFKDPTRILMEHDLDSIPDNICWCGNDTIACSFEDEVKLYGPDGLYVTFWYPFNVTNLRSEIDGLKVITTEKIYFLSRVQPQTSNIFRIGSTEPGAMLLDSFELLEDHAPKAIEIMKNFALEKGVLDCITAAVDEFQPKFQKILLNAASFGKASLQYKSFDANIFVDACNTIKLLNCFRSFGIFLTAEEYKSMSLKGVIDRLLAYRKYYECIQICKLAGKQSLLGYVFTKWAKDKIKSSSDMDDNELLETIKSRLSVIRVMDTIKMVSISKVAYLEGRFQLSRDLALLEKNEESKIEQLFNLDDDSLALKESIKVQNPSLTVSLLVALSKKLTNSQLTKLLILDMINNPLYLYYMRRDKAYLYDFYRQTDQFVDLAHVLLQQGKEQQFLHNFLPQIKDLYSKVQNNEMVHDIVEQLQRQEKLWVYQESLGKRFGISFIDMTLDQTLSKLIETGQDKEVKEIVKKFKVNEKQLYHLKCRMLVETRKFDELLQFAHSKKSPIGYMPFYRYLKTRGHIKEAASYVGMISGLSYQERKKLYVECMSFRDAIQLAGKERDIAGLKEIYNAIPANEPEAKAFANETMSTI
ncbi:vps16p [Saccharomyces arboricola H-6]|uniref:Probable vacuolar protein sorting-associated protein 16 homolog n=1 Tax=Saccharomyces arboricola (strain H-6 / AS 2.3317 / CBS 10644) TaxID=1160507 RepID=J8Q163_SACAR|nr:vps16p [Saccharomyces arboricola H-6]